MSTDSSKSDPGHEPGQADDEGAGDGSASTAESESESASDGAEEAAEASATESTGDGDDKPAGGPAAGSERKQKTLMFGSGGPADSSDDKEEDPFAADGSLKDSVKPPAAGAGPGKKTLMGGSPTKSAAPKATPRRSSVPPIANRSEAPPPPKRSEVPAPPKRDGGRPKPPARKPPPMRKRPKPPARETPDDKPSALAASRQPPPRRPPRRKSEAPPRPKSEAPPATDATDATAEMIPDPPAIPAGVPAPTPSPQPVAATTAPEAATAEMAPPAAAAAPTRAAPEIAAPTPSPAPVMAEPVPSPAPPPVDLSDFEHDAQVDPRSIAEVCQAELAGKPSATRTARLHFEIGHAADDDTTALKHFRMALEREPGHLPAIRAARALQLKKGNVKAALTLFDAEIKLASSPTQKALLHYAKGVALDDIGNDRDAARECFAEAVKIDSDNATVLKAYEHSELKAKDWNKLTRALEFEANAVAEQPEHRAAVLVARARLLERRLQKTDEATAQLEIALGLDPQTPIALQALKRLFFAQARWRDLIGVLEQEATLTTDGVVQTLAWWNISRVYSEQLGSRPEAIAALTKACEISSTDSSLLGELARLQEQDGDRAGLAATLAKLADSLTRPQERISVLQRLAQLNEHPDASPSTAIRWYEAALAIDPSFTPALRALDSLYEKVEDWNALAFMYLNEGGANVESARRAMAYARAADVMEMRLGRPDEAAEHYAHALSLDPIHAGAFKALVRLYKGSQKHHELIELYGRAVDSARSDDVAITYLFKIGAIYEDTLADVQSAADTYRRILDRQADHLGAIHSLQRAAESAGLYRDLVDALDKEVKLAPGPDVLMLQHRAAEVIADRLNDHEAAISRFRVVLKRNPRHVPTLVSLGRLYKALGRHEDLLDIYERQLDSKSSPLARVALMLQIAQLCESELANVDRAIGYYRQVVEADAHHAVARASLARLLRQSGDFDQLAKVLTTELEGTKQPMHAARTALLLGEVHELHRKRADDAVLAYQRALVAMPGYQPALDALSRVHGQQKAWKELAEVLVASAEAASDTRLSIDSRLRAASIRAGRMGQTSEAIDMLEELTVADPTNIAALLTLEPLYVQLGSAAQLRDVLDKQAKVLNNPKACVAALAARLRLLETSEDNDVSAEIRAVSSGILALEPANSLAVDALERLGQRTGDTRLLAEVDTLSTRTTTEPGMLAVHYARLGYSLLSHNPSAALNAFRTALDHNAELLSAIRGLLIGAHAMKDYEGVVDAYQREAEWIDDFSAGADLLVASAVVRVARLHDVDGAIDDCQRALSLYPDHEEAADRLTKLLRHNRDYDRLVDQLQQAASQADKRQRKISLWQAVGRLYADDKHDLGAAIIAVKRAEKLDPDDLETMMLLVDLHSRDLQWREAAELLTKVVGRDEDAVDAQLQLAKINTQHLPDPVKAKKGLERVLAARPGDREALRMLLQLHLDAGDRDKAREVSKQLLEAAAGDDAMRAWALVEIGRLELKNGSHAEAAEALRSAVVLTGLAGDASTSYRRLLGDKEPWERYVSALKEHIRSGKTKDAEQLADLYLELGRTLHADMSRTGDAFEVLQEGMTRCNDHHLLALEQAELLVKTGRQTDAVAAFQSLLARHPDNGAGWRGLTQVLQQLGRHAEAAVSASALLVLGNATDVERNLAAERALAPGVGRAGTFGPGMVRAISAGDGEDETRMAFTLNVLADGLAKAYPVPYELYGVKKGDRVKARSGHPLRNEIDKLAVVFGIEDFDVYIHAGLGGDVALELSSPPSIMVPTYFSEIPEAQRVFLLARPLAAIASGVHASMKLSADELAMVFAAAVRNLIDGFEDGQHDATRLVQLEQMLGPSWFGRGKFEEAMQQYYAEPVDIEQWWPSAELTFARAAALLAGDLDECVAALRTVGAIPGGDDGPALVESSAIVADLLRFWMSEPALELRRLAGMV